MSLSKFNEAVNNVSNLPNKPSMMPEELKATFDKAGLDIKTYLNEVLTTEVDRVLSDKVDKVPNATLMTSEEKLKLSNIYTVGSIFLTEEVVDPAILYGGTWEKIKEFDGGELIAFGNASNTGNNNETVTRNSSLAFSDSKIPQKQSNIVSYVDDILEFRNDTFSVKPKGIVGMIEAKYSISGSGSAGMKSHWYGGNFNALPTGVTISGDTQVMKTATEGFCGTEGSYQYTVTDEADANTSFYINPSASMYGGDFMPCTAGTKCSLQVKVFAKSGKTYAWKRIA